MLWFASPLVVSRSFDLRWSRKDSMKTIRNLFCAILVSISIVSAAVAADTQIAIARRPSDVGVGPRRTFELFYIVDGAVKAVHPLGPNVSYGTGGGIVATVVAVKNRTHTLTLWQSKTGEQIQTFDVDAFPVATASGAPPVGVVISPDMSTVYVTGRQSKLAGVVFKITLPDNKCTAITMPDDYNTGCFMLALPDGFGIFLPGDPLHLYSAHTGRFVPKLAGATDDGYIYVPGVGILGWDRNGEISIVHGASVDDANRPDDIPKRLGIVRWAVAAKWGGADVAVFGIGVDNHGAKKIVVYDPKKRAVVAEEPVPSPIVNGISSTTDCVVLLSWDGQLWRLRRDTKDINRFGDLAVASSYALESVLVTGN